MSEYIITIEQIKDLVMQSAVEAVDGYKSGVVKQIWQYPLLPKITRCRDCKFGVDGGEYCAEDCADSWNWRCVEPDGFCAWGERRTNDN